jgi:ornithine cyclodeaminase/alanine dehydrogenase-like protein (mu-crystallin family)
MQVIPLEAFRDKIPIAVAVAAVERGFRALGLGQATLPDPMVMELADLAAEVHVKGAHLRHHRIIVTATASTTPVIKAAWVAKGTHITSVGTGSPEKVELEPGLLLKADKLIADRVFQTARYGNLHHAIAAGVLGPERVYGELGDLATGRLAGREAPGEITVADLTGVGVQDAAIAAVVVETLGL